MILSCLHALIALAVLTTCTAAPAQKCQGGSLPIDLAPNTGLRAVGYRPVFGGKEGVHHTLTLDCYDKYLNMYAYDAKGKVIHEEQCAVYMNFKTPKLADSQLELKLLDAPAQGSWHIYKDPSGALPLVCN